MRSVESRVIGVIATHLKFDRAKIGTESNFLNDLDTDSLDSVLIIMALEEEFRIEIPDEDSEKMYTVGDCIRYIKGQLD